MGLWTTYLYDKRGRKHSETENVTLNAQKDITGTVISVLFWIPVVV